MCPRIYIYNMTVEVFNSLSPFILIIFSALVSVIVFMIKKLLDRVRRLETMQMQQKPMTRSEVKEMIEDKISPINQRLESVDKKLDKIIDYMIVPKQG